VTQNNNDNVNNNLAIQFLDELAQNMKSIGIKNLGEKYLAVEYTYFYVNVNNSLNQSLMSPQTFSGFLKITKQTKSLKLPKVSKLCSYDEEYN